MLRIEIEPQELYDERTQEFFNVKGQTLVLEHSLVSLSKWESQWHKPFLTTEEKTREETIDYIRCMTITQNVDPDIYIYMTDKVINEISSYIEDPMTATTFSKSQKGRPNREVITAEIIYFWMVTFNIPSEYQKWHLNKLLTLINVCNIKNQPPKKMSKRDIYNQNRALNAARRNSINTRG